MKISIITKEINLMRKNMKLFETNESNNTDFSNIFYPIIVHSRYTKVSVLAQNFDI